jgi:hypothetical protein
MAAAIRRGGGGLNVPKMAKNGSFCHFQVNFGVSHSA